MNIYYILYHEYKYVIHHEYMLVLTYNEYKYVIQHKYMLYDKIYKYVIHHEYTLYDKIYNILHVFVLIFIVYGLILTYYVVVPIYQNIRYITEYILHTYVIYNKSVGNPSGFQQIYRLRSRFST